MKFDDGKYEVVFDEQGLPQQVLRNGEPWRDIVGDKLIYWMLVRIAELEKWHEAVMNECMSVEACYFKDDPKKTVASLIDWHVDNERYWNKEGEGA